MENGGSCSSLAALPENDQRQFQWYQAGTALKKKEEERFSDQFGRSVRALSDYLGMGLQIAVSFAFFVFLGYWADDKFGTSPLLLLIGVMTGLAGMVLVLMKVLRQANKKK